MSRVVWKYNLNMGETKLILPEGSNVVAVGEQDTTLCIWVEQSPIDRDLGVEHTFYVVGTGTEIPEGYTHMDHRGAVFTPPFVWHIYEGWE